MIQTVALVNNPSVERLLNLWADRYQLDLSSLVVNNLLSDNLVQQVASPQGRASTAAKMKENILNVNCQMAWIQTKTLYAYIPNILDLNEARRITQFAFRVYRKLLEIYQAQSLTETATNCEASLCALGMPPIRELAYALEPTLLMFQEQHMVSKDWRSLGFMTSQLNFCNKLILKKLQPIEQALLAPYLRFIEEQVAMPWQRVCVAAGKHEVGGAKLNLVEKMLPAAPEIAKAIYQRLMELLPNHRSRRGTLNDANVMHSCLRDLNMFQAYLWLCFLEDTIAPIEHELLPLCAMVVEGVNIKWDMTQKWCEVLASEILSRVTPAEKKLLLPYTQQLQAVFWQERHRLGFQEDVAQDNVRLSVG
jgi:hypothetical protein